MAGRGRRPFFLALSRKASQAPQRRGKLAETESFSAIFRTSQDVLNLFIFNVML